MRFRPRFSIRTLAIFVTVVCAYFGAWEATKRYGIEKRYQDDARLVLERRGDIWTATCEETAPIPFVLRCDEWEWSDPNGHNLSAAPRRYICGLAEKG
jgi:hypothetical protein